MHNRVFHSPLKVGALVAFKPGTTPYNEGLRRGTIVSAGTSLRAAWAEILAKKKAIGLIVTADDEAYLAELEANDSELPLIHVVAASCPAGFYFAVHPSFFDVIDDDGCEPRN
jgi:hypothetical protein